MSEEQKEAAGPIALPTILMSIVVPKDIPLYCFGVDNTITFITPTIVSGSTYNDI
jgi:hypothetical protein